MVGSAQQSSLSSAAQAEVSTLDVTSVLALPTVGNAAEALENLDMKIEEITAVSRNLRSRRSCLPPVSRLPPELLSRIFAIVASNEKPEAPQELTVTQNHSKLELKVPWLGWIRVTHVCRHWRQIALADVCFWADIPSITPEWTRELLLRTADKAFPLSLSIRYGREQAKRVPEVVMGPLMSALPRIRQFVFEGSETTLHPFLAILSATSHPLQLECLEFHADELDRAYSLTHCIESASRFIQATDPLLLRHLVIHNCKLPTDDIGFPLLPRLEHFELSITMLVIGDSSAWFDSCVMQALSNMPNLESLKVQNLWHNLQGPGIVLPTPDGVHNDTTQLLQHLQRVDVTYAGVNHFTALMARNISFIPPSVSIKFEITLRNAGAILFEAAADAIVRWLKPFTGAPGTSIEPLRTISLKPGPFPWHITVDGWTMKNASMKHPVRPKVSLNFRGSEFVEQHIDHHGIIVKKLCEHLHVKDVSVLRLSNLFKHSEGYRRLYMSMDAIEHLRLSKKISTKLVEAMMTSPPVLSFASSPLLQPESSSKITVYLPKLSALTISNTVLDYRSSDSSGALTFTEILRTVLAERKLQLGVPLQRLRLAHCRIETSDAQALQEDGLISKVSHFNKRRS